jgi:hypothetical protein
MCCGLRDFILFVHFAASSVTWVDFSDYKGEPQDFWYVNFAQNITSWIQYEIPRRRHFTRITMLHLPFCRD